MDLPHFLVSEWPTADQPTGHHVVSQLVNLGSYVARFHAALSLIERSKQDLNEAINKRDEGRRNLKFRDFGRNDKIRSEFRESWTRLALWKQIAERDAIMTVWDFSTTMYNIRKSLDRCKSLDRLVSRPNLERVLKNLSAAFPNRKKARDASAHPADFTKSPEEIDRHSFDGGYEGAGISISEGATNTFVYGSSLSDGTVVFTHEGVIIEAKITLESLAVLASLRDEMYACFDDAVRETRKMMFDRMGLRPPEGAAGEG